MADVHSCCFHGRFCVSGAEEYCQFDTFNVTCPPGQVIVMNEAQYGRLRIGRCMSRDYGFLGCTADVIDVLDRTCSGRRRCLLPVPHIRQLVQPCPKDLTSYLEAGYHCEKGSIRLFIHRKIKKKEKTNVI